MWHFMALYISRQAMHRLCVPLVCLLVGARLSRDQPLRLIRRLNGAAYRPFNFAVCSVFGIVLVLAPLTQ